MKSPVTTFSLDVFSKLSTVPFIITSKFGKERGEKKIKRIDFFKLMEFVFPSGHLSPKGSYENAILKSTIVYKSNIFLWLSIEPYASC